MDQYKADWMGKCCFIHRDTTDNTFFACEISPRGVFIVAKFCRQKGISSIVFSLEMYEAQLTH